MTSALFWDCILKCSESYVDDYKTVVTSYQLKCCSILAVKLDGGHVLSCCLMVVTEHKRNVYRLLTDIMQANQFPNPNENLYCTALRIPFRRSTYNISCIFTCKCGIVTCDRPHVQFNDRKTPAWIRHCGRPCLFTLSILKQFMRIMGSV